jgi:uncharacterized membrane protein YkoI
MHYDRSTPTRPAQRALLVLALFALFALPATLAYGQQSATIWQKLTSWVDECGRIEGTVQVADETPQATMLRLARITEEEAREAALATLSAATVTEIELDEEDGYLVYEVELLREGVEHEVVVDAGSGAVLCTERDDRWLN